MSGTAISTTSRPASSTATACMAPTSPCLARDQVAEVAVDALAAASALGGQRGRLAQHRRLALVAANRRRPTAHAQCAPRHQARTVRQAAPRACCRRRACPRARAARARSAAAGRRCPFGPAAARRWPRTTWSATRDRRACRARPPARPARAAPRGPAHASCPAAPETSSARRPTAHTAPGNTRSRRARIEQSLELSRGDAVHSDHLSLYRTWTNGST